MTIFNSFALGINAGTTGTGAKLPAFKNHAKGCREWTGTITSKDVLGHVIEATGPVEALLFYKRAPYQGGIFHVLWDGTGTVNVRKDFSGSLTKTVIDSNHFTVNIVPDSLSYFHLILDNIDPLNHPTNFRVVHDDDFSTYETQPFTDLLLDELNKFDYVRTIGFQGPNSSAEEVFAERTRPESFSWRNMPDGARGSTPIEVLVDLANTITAIPHFHIPAKADSQYITYMLTYIRDNYAGDFIIELGNEPWNSASGFVTYQYLLSLANADVRVTSVGKNAVADMYSIINYELQQEINTLFGANAGRCHKILNCQANDNTAFAARVLGRHWVGGDALTQDDLGFSAIGIAPYFGMPSPYYTDGLHVLTEAPFDYETSAQLLYNELKNGEVLVQVADMRAWHLFNGWDGTGGWLEFTKWNVREMKTFASALPTPLPVFAYESGQHLDSPGTALHDDVFIPFQRDARMGLLYTDYHTMMQTELAAPLFVFDLAGGWGIKENYYDTVTVEPKYDAVMSFLATLDGASPPAGISITATSAAKSEGDAGTTLFTFAVSRSGGNDTSVSVDWAVTGSGANPANATDFVGGVLPSGTITFAIGEVTKTINVEVQGDLTEEEDETFVVTLSNPTNSATINVASASGTILDDDTVVVIAPTLSITAVASSLSEGDSGTTTYTFTVTRNGDTTGSNSVNWAVTGSGANPATANDFVGSAFPSGTVTFAIGETTKSITVDIQGDTEVEPNENFVVTLSSPTNGATLAQSSTVTATINNDDAYIQFKVFREITLPVTLEPYSIYLIAPAARPDYVEVYVTGSVNTIVKRIINENDVMELINNALSGSSSLNIVADITTRDALTPATNIQVLVLDATDDPTVASGAATYVYQTTNSTWFKLSESESMDVALTWAALSGKPTSTVVDIDDAVIKRHSHANKAELDKIGEDVNGNITYNGLLPIIGWTSTEW